METTYRTYKFYESNGSRLAIFGVQKEDGCEVYVIPCNKKDQFSKDVAKEILHLYSEGNPVRVQQYHLGDVTKQREFMAWCEKEYYKIHTESFDLPKNILKMEIKFSNKLYKSPKEMYIYSLQKI